MITIQLCGLEICMCYEQYGFNGKHIVNTIPYNDIYYERITDNAVKELICKYYKVLVKKNIMNRFNTILHIYCNIYKDNYNDTNYAYFFNRCLI
jgi:hypothetical protein